MINNVHLRNKTYYIYIYIYNKIKLYYSIIIIININTIYIMRVLSDFNNPITIIFNLFLTIIIKYYHIYYFFVK